MRVADFLKKYPGEVVVASDADTVASTAQQIAARSKGVACICDSERSLLGVASVVDISRALAEHGTDCVSLPIGKVMTRNVGTCTVDDTVETVLNLMRERGVRHVPVTDQGKLVTMISMRDLLHYSAEQAKRDIDSLTSFIFGVGYR